MTIKTFNLGGSGSNQNPSPFSSLFALIFGIVILAGFLFISFEIVTLLYKFGWIFLVIALITNYRVPLAYLSAIVNKFKTSVLSGLISLAYNVIFYPFVFIWLIITGIFNNKLGEIKDGVESRYGNKKQDQSQNSLTDAEGYTPYEEIKSELNKTGKERRENS